MAATQIAPIPAMLRVNDLRDDEDTRVLFVAGQLALARLGRPYDPWDWQPCTQDEVDRARLIVEGYDAMTAYRINTVGTTAAGGRRG